MHVRGAPERASWSLPRGSEFVGELGEGFFGSWDGAEQLCLAASVGDVAARVEPAEHRLGLKVAGVKGKSGRRQTTEKKAEVAPVGVADKDKGSEVGA